jgi:hypothetical protein
MKRSRRVVLTMMGTAAIGAVSMGFVRRSRLDCGPGTGGPDGRLIDGCRRPYVTYGGFGVATHRFQFRGGGS